MSTHTHTSAGNQAPAPVVATVVETVVMATAAAAAAMVRAAVVRAAVRAALAKGVVATAVVMAVVVMEVVGLDATGEGKRSAHTVFVLLIKLVKPVRIFADPGHPILLSFFAP